MDEETCSRSQQPFIVSYVCVHGIGRQVAAQTALDVATAFELGVDALNGQVLAQPRNRTEPDLIASHADITFEVEIPGTPTFEARFYDGWWDERAPVAAATRSFFWTIKVAPIMVWMIASLWLFEIDELFERRQEQRKLRNLLPAFVAILGCVVIAPIALVLTLTIVLLSLPFSKARNFLSEVFARWLGDAWLYQADQLDAEVLPFLAELVKSVSLSSDHTVIVGHSQGAEIGRRVALLEEPDACVWIGSGEAHLGILRTLRKNWWFPMAFAVYLSVFAMLFAQVINKNVQAFGAWIGAAGVPFQTTQYGVAAIAESSLKASEQLISSLLEIAPYELSLLVLTIGVALLLHRLLRRPLDLSKQPDCEVLTLKSLLDPVSIGPHKSGAFVRYVPVSKARDWAKEHTSYFMKEETGLALIEATIGGEAVYQTKTMHVPQPGVWISLIGLLSAGVCILGFWALGETILAIFR